MPIDVNFQKKRQKNGSENNVAVWGPLDPPRQLGIRGTHVAVDWDICTGCRVCADVCPQKVYEWVQTPDHPTSDEKPFPIGEPDCVQCYRCEAGCPVQAIKVVFPGPTGFRLAMVPLFFIEVLAGALYGVFFGPALGITILFWLGWVTMAIAVPLFLSIETCFKKMGKPGEGKSIMDTTVLVDKGTYAVVRHPQLLGGILMMLAAILVSQHWLVAILGILVSAWWYIEAVREEKGLLVKFEGDYADYMQKVPRMNLLIGIIRLLTQRNHE